MKLKPPSDLNFAGLFAFIYKVGLAQGLVQTLHELVALGRYGNRMSRDWHEENGTLDELRAMGLDAVAQIVEQTDPNRLFQDHIWDVDRPQQIARWQKEMDAKRAFEAKIRPGGLGLLYTHSHGPSSTQ